MAFIKCNYSKETFVFVCINIVVFISELSRDAVKRQMRGRAIILSKDVVLENSNNNSKDPSSTVLNKDRLKSNAMTL